MQLYFGGKVARDTVEYCEPNSILVLPAPVYWYCPSILVLPQYTGSIPGSQYSVTTYGSRVVRFDADLDCRGVFFYCSRVWE